MHLILNLFIALFMTLRLALCKLHLISIFKFNIQSETNFKNEKLRIDSGKLYWMSWKLKKGKRNRRRKGWWSLRDEYKSVVGERIEIMRKEREIRIVWREILEQERTEG